eukprot:TRINITY_DN66564_c0_g1_i1.p1 TRINITY_DN66564_c0_g1~~TRINITY_DN66564_c0_g1_i1.p1  ORF type:complete len:129 (-),score=23.94 TRINITY_DN66564_c0_g1_i1:140-526(-)
MAAIIQLNAVEDSRKLLVDDTLEENHLEALPVDHQSPSTNNADAQTPEATTATPQRGLLEAGGARAPSGVIKSSTEEINAATRPSSKEDNLTPDKALDMLTRMLLGEGAETVLAELDSAAEKDKRSKE